MIGYAGANRPQSIGCLGDSLTGWTTTNGGFTGWVQQLQALFPRRVITNFGIGGFTSSSIAGRWASAVKNCGYDKITVMGGINDIVGATLGSTVITNLDTIFDQAIALGVKIFALKMIPFGNHTLWNSTRQGYLDEVNAHLVSKVAANSSLMTLVDTYTMFGAAGDAQDLHADYDNGDGLHLNLAGHTVLANYMKGIIW